MVSIKANFHTVVVLLILTLCCTIKLFAQEPLLTTSIDTPFLAFRQAIVDVKKRLKTIPKNSRLSYIRTQTNDEQQTHRSRYIPQGSAGGQWEKISSSTGESPDEVVRLEDDVLLGFESYDLSQAILIDETEQNWVFEIPNTINLDINSDVIESDESLEKTLTNKLSNALKTQIEVSKGDPHFVSYHVYSVKSFKPSMMVKINKFDILLKFKEAWAGGPFVRYMQQKHLVGSFGFFISINEHTTTTYSDFGLVNIELDE